MKKSKSIQNILRSTYWILMFVILLAASLLFAAIEYAGMRKSLIEHFQRTCSGISREVSEQLDLMNTVSVNILYSTQLKGVFQRYFSQQDPPSGKERLSLETSMSDLLYSIRGTNNDIRQIILYDLKKGCYCTGNYTGYQDLSVTEMPWYEDTFSQGGLAYYPPSAPNPLYSSSSGAAPTRLYSSLCRVFYDNYHKPLGIVQVMQYQDVAFHSAIHHGSTYDIRVHIYDGQGNLSYSGDEDAAGHFDYLEAALSGKSSVFNSYTGRWEYIFTASVSGGFTTVVTVDRIQAFFPILRQLSTMLVIFVLAALFCYFIAWGMSRKLSSPLVFMYHYLDQTDFAHRWEALQMPDSHVQEIDKLRDSLNEFRQRQMDSMNSLLLLEKQKTRAQILAFQSQTNPHFLYNALSTIHAMAEEGMTREIQQMCLNITEILRYISSDKNTLSTLEEELEQCDRYLDCLKLRFGDSLSYSIDVPDEMLELMIPKLSIQLLVENSGKFASKASPPWQIQIQGQRLEQIWIVEVLDNGPGFSQDALQRLHDQIEEVHTSGLSPSLELNGMGLLNIYMRFYLLYRDGFIFDAGTQPGAGAVVVIGGKCLWRTD